MEGLSLAFPKLLFLCNQSSLPDFRSLQRIHQSLHYWIFQVKDFLFWLRLHLGKDGVHSAIWPSALRALELFWAPCQPSALGHGVRREVGEDQGLPGSAMLLTNQKGRHSFLRATLTIPATVQWRAGMGHQWTFSPRLRWFSCNSDHYHPTLRKWEEKHQPQGGCSLHLQDPELSGRSVH